MSSDEDVPLIVFKGKSQSKLSRKSSEIRNKKDHSDEVKTLEIGRLARHLLYATISEKDGALKDAIGQKLHYFSKKEYPYALQQASSAIEQSFGCKVVHRSNQSHIVRTRHEEDNYPLDSLAQAKKGLLSAILMFIFASKSDKTNECGITETSLLNFLNALGLSYTSPDPVFGDIGKLISPVHTAEFIHEGYISFLKSFDRYETQVITYDWGPRAALVCNPVDVLNSFCYIMKDPHVNKWSNLDKTAKQLEEGKKEIIKNSEQYMSEG